MAERLQKVMANAGIASRRASEKMILAGRVRVNGKVIKELGQKVDGNDRGRWTLDRTRRKGLLPFL